MRAAWLIVAALATLVGVKLAADYAAGQAAGQGPETPDQDTGGTALDYVNPLGQLGSAWEQQRTEADMQETNVRAFLDMISRSEGTDRRADSYAVCYAYKHTIADFSDHPAVTGEWRGEALPDSMCRGAGLSPGCVSTAAGRYQIIKPTWLTVKRALRLADFSPASQDLAAIYLVRQRGALAAVQAGRLDEAIELCRREWASLPGAGYGQGERKFSELQAAFVAAGGTLA